MTDLTDMETFKLYKQLSPRARAKDLMNDPMEAAEMAETDGEFAFLADPLSDQGAVPAALLDQAIALGPRQVNRASLWKQIVAAVLTFAAFGSGSYALANGLSVDTTVTDPFSTDAAGLFEAASSTGFFTYE